MRSTRTTYHTKRLITITHQLYGVDKTKTITGGYTTI